MQIPISHNLQPIWDRSGACSGYAKNGQWEVQPHVLCDADPEINHPTEAMFFYDQISRHLLLEDLARDPILPLPQNIDWSLVHYSGKAAGGLVDGVHFYNYQGMRFVLKGSSHGIQEFIANKLASKCGLKSPEMKMVKVPDAFSEAIGLQKGNQALLMAFVEGKSFDNLTPSHRQDFENRTPEAREISRELGACLAFDYFIGNPDRFPTSGLLGCNAGNIILLPNNEIVPIDNTFMESQYRQEYMDRLPKYLELLADHPRQGLLMSLQRMESFFPDWEFDAELSDWMLSAIRGGFQDGVRDISTLNDSDIDSIFADSGAEGNESSILAGFLKANLSIMKASKAKWLDDGAHFS